MNPDEIAIKIGSLEVEQSRQGVKLDTIANELKEVKENSKEFNKLVESVHDLALSVREIAIRQENDSEKTNRHECAIEELKSKPAKRWDIVQTGIITAVVAGVLGYVIKTIFG